MSVLRSRAIAGAVAAVLFVGLSGCTGGHHSAVATVVAATGRPIGQGVTVTGERVPTALAATLQAAAVPVFDQQPALTESLTPTLAITPSGPLASPITVTFHPTQPVASDGSVAVATAETSGGPWSLLQATVSPDGDSVSVQTDHLSLFTIIKIQVGEALANLKTEFLDGITSNVTTEASKPVCDNETKARTGYTISSSAKQTAYWCFGIDSGKPVLKVVNRRRYPLALAHPGLTFTKYGQLTTGLEDLAHFGSGSQTILLPFQEADFKLTLAPGESGGISSMMSGTAQSLYQLQVALSVAASILTRFGASEGTIANGAITKTAFDKVAALLDKAVRTKDCFNAVQHANPGEMISGCFSPAQLADDFGWQGLLLAPFVAVGGLLEFFRSELNAFGDQLDGRDKYQVVIARQSVGDCLSATQFASVYGTAASAAGQPIKNIRVAFGPVVCQGGWAFADLRFDFANGTPADGSMVVLRYVNSSWKVESDGTGALFYGEDPLCNQMPPKILAKICVHGS